MRLHDKHKQAPNKKANMSEKNSRYRFQKPHTLELPDTSMTHPFY